MTQFLLTLAFFLSSIDRASAFVGPVSFAHSHQLAVSVSVRPDSSEAIAEAEAICGEKGSASAECAVAWDTVEEIDSSYNPSLDIEASTSSYGDEYASLIRTFAMTLQQTQQKLQQMRALAEKLSKLESDHPSVVKLGELPQSLKLALAEAKAADDVFGPNSKESDTAWQIVEDAMMGDLDDAQLADSQGETQHVIARYQEAALRGHHHDYSVVVDPDSLRDAVDAFGTIEHVARLVRLETDRLATLLGKENTNAPSP
jgi:hypothetical protein